MNLKKAAALLQAELKGTDVVYQGVSIDSRTVQAGQLFVAFQGPKFDGHDFIADAEAAKAAAVIISKPIKTSLPSIQVKNTHAALWQLAQAQRQELQLPFFAVTGSCGKTTTKMLLASILQQAGKVLANPASYNNDIGVPLTILQVTPEYDFAINEIGTNHPGEIEPLTKLVQPKIAILTNAAAAHLAGFGSVAAVAHEKGTIFNGLTKDGTAIINADDPHASTWRDMASKHNIVTFALQNVADVTAKQIQFNAKGQASFILSTPAGEVPVQLQLLGEHNVANALAAAAAAYANGIALPKIQAGLNQAQAVTKRLVEQKGLHGATVIDDTYNANPLSVSAAIKLLAQRNGESVLVLGDMLELGNDAAQFHRELGSQAAALGIKHLYCFGDLTQHTAAGFGNNAHYFSEREQLINSLRDAMQANMTVLVKGSRSMKMELVAQALLQS